MADTTHNEVFDRLSQSFKESNLSQSTSPASQSLLNTTPSVVSQPAGKPDQKLQQYIGYKEWLDTVKRDYESALEARRIAITSEDQDQLNERILRLQKQLTKESTNHSLKELAVKSTQSALEQRDKFHESTSKQIALVTEVIGHQKVCQRVQEELDAVRKECLEYKRKNREVMMELLQKNEEMKKQASNYDDDKHQQVEEEINRILSHITIGRNILQGLIVGSGVNWAEDKDLKDVMLELGKPVQL